jgi:hypothetical protein
MMSDYQMREVYGKKVLTMNIPNGFKTLPPNACFRQLRKQEKLIAELQAKNKRLVELVLAFKEAIGSSEIPTSEIYKRRDAMFSEALKEKDDE